VEVYLPDRGWVEFEPTAGRPPIDQSIQLELSESVPLPNENRTFPEIRFFSSDQIIASVILMIVILPGMVFTAERVWYLSRPVEYILVKARRQFFLFAYYFGLNEPKIYTVVEIVATVKSQLKSQLDHPVRKWVARRVQEAVAANADLFIEVAYQGRSLQSLEKSKLISNLFRIRRMGRLFLLISMFQKK
jgi:hypothetical protein